MKFMLAVGVMFGCSIFVIQESSSLKLKDENQTEVSRIGVNSSPAGCAVRTTFLKNELPSKGFAFYEAGDKFLSVFVQVVLPDDGRTYYLKGGSVNIKGQENEKATTFRAEEVLSSNMFRVKVPIENVHAKLVIDQMKYEVGGLGKASGTVIPENDNRTPDKVVGQNGLELSIILELETIKKK